MEVKQVDKMEAIKYLIPVLRELDRLAVPYEITDKHIVFDIPRFIPVENGVVEKGGKDV